MTTLYTIGHSNHALRRFLTLLGRFHVERLVDVRSHPYSRFAPHFRKRAFAAALERSSVGYTFLGDALGGRPEGDFYQPDGTLDRARRADAPDFLAAVDELIALAAERPTVILCAEEDPARCHRRTLITPVLLARSVEVAHIRGDGRLQPECADGTVDGQLGLFG